MCGLAGILNSTHSSTSDQLNEALRSMLAALKHRGPDGEDVFTCSTGAAYLAHTRLSIIDLSDSGRQPMHSLDGRYTIVFNGEIYNYQLLREGLIAKGYRFQSQSDTEVIIALYQEYGPNCVSMLRGMFAFLIWDSRANTAFAARDPLGIKPFYFGFDDQRNFLFASELKVLQESGLLSDTLSETGLFSFLKQGTVSEPATMLSACRLLEAGHMLTWTNGKIEHEPYWSLNFKTEDISYDQAVSKTRAALEDSIRAHLVSDVPVGLFLSGGIDSCALLALASEVADAPINTYSIAFEEPEWNEGDLAAKAAKHFGANHTELVLTDTTAQPLFKEFLEAVDQPTIDGFNTYCVSKLAKQNNEKVVISGLGGDELFRGYASFEKVPKISRYAKTAYPFKWLEPLIRLAASNGIRPKLARIFDSINANGDLEKTYQSFRGIFSKREASHLLRAYSSSNCRPPNSDPKENVFRDLGTLDQISALEISQYMRNQLLRDSDVMSMACGLELRVPLVDHVLYDAITSIPANHRLQAGKKLLVDAVPELPNWIVTQPKRGFRFPFDQWFSQHWKNISPTQTISAEITLQPWYRRWSLLVLDSWLEKHKQ